MLDRRVGAAAAALLSLSLGACLLAPATAGAAFTGPTASADFSPNRIPLSGTTTLTISMSHGADAATGAGIVDTLGPGLVVATPNNLINTCGSGATIVAGKGVSVSGLSIGASTSCSISFSVTATAAGLNSNALSYSSDGNDPIEAPDAHVTVVAPPIIAASFDPASVAIGNGPILSFTITNPDGNAVALTGVSFSTTLSAGLRAAKPTDTVCGSGHLTITNQAFISLTGLTLQPGSSCQFGVNVAVDAVGEYTVTTTSIWSNEGGPGNSASAVLNVGILPPTITAVFGVNSIQVGGTTSLSFTIANPNGQPDLVVGPGVTTHNSSELACQLSSPAMGCWNPLDLTGVAFTDTLPAGLVVADPNGLTGHCFEGTIAAAANGTTVSLTGGRVPSGSQCTFSVNVAGVMPGVKRNDTGPVSSLQSLPGGPGSAEIVVIAAASTPTPTPTPSPGTTPPPTATSVGGSSDGDSPIVPLLGLMAAALLTAALIRRSAAGAALT